MMNGRDPVVVVGRPRSGSRLVAHLLLDAGVSLGRAIEPGSLDAVPIWQRFVAPLLSGRFPLANGWSEDRAFVEWCGGRLHDALARLHGPSPPAGPWGWKYCETAFAMPVVKQLLPGARFVHVIRDGRDVCVSCDGYFGLCGPRPAVWDAPSVDGRPTEYAAFCRAVTVGSPDITKWRGIDLSDLAQCIAQRFLLGMQAWMSCVTEARRHGRELGGDYVEVSYERLCREPRAVARELLAWVADPRLSSRPVVVPTTTARVGRWRTMRLTPAERRDLDRALDHGEPLLRQLAYDD